MSKGCYLCFIIDENGLSQSLNLNRVNYQIVQGMGKTFDKFLDLCILIMFMSLM